MVFDCGGLGDLDRDQPPSFVRGTSHASRAFDTAAAAAAAEDHTITHTHTHTLRSLALVLIGRPRIFGHLPQSAFWTEMQEFMQHKSPATTNSQGSTELG